MDALTPRRYLAAALAALLVVPGCGDKAPGAAPSVTAGKPASPAPQSGLTIGPVTVPKLDTSGPLPGLAIRVVDELARDVPELARSREKLLASERKATQMVFDAARGKPKAAGRKAVSGWRAPFLALAEAILGIVPSAAAAAEGGGIPGYTIVGMIYSTLIGGVSSMVGKVDFLSELKAKDGSVDASLKVTTDKKGAHTIAVETKIDAAELFLKANSRLSLTGSMCPDANGQVDFTLKLQSDGRAGGGGATTYDRSIEAHVMAAVDDEANIINLAYHLDQSTRSTAGGRQVYVDTNQTIEVPRGEYGNMRAGELKWRASSQANVTDAQAAVAALQDAFHFALGAVIVAEHDWKGGKCIEIKANSPGRVKPGATSKIPVAVVVRADGSSVPAKVKVELAGGKSVDPALIPKAPGELTHVAPAEKKAAMKITLNASSRRGRAKLELTLDTVGGAFRAEGGLDDFHGTGVICDLAKTFTIEGGGNVVTFEPTSEKGGNYSYKGTMMGFGVFGKGTYTVTYQGDMPVGIIGTGVGSVKSPMGVFSNSGTEKYVLTPRDGC